MKGFVLGFLVASALGAGLVWAQQDGYILDQYGQFQGYTYKNQPMGQPDYMAPGLQMQQQLNGVLGQRNPC